MSSEIKQLELEFEGDLKKYNGGNTTEYGSFFKKHSAYDVFIMTVDVNNRTYDVWLYGVKRSFCIIISFGNCRKDEITFAWEDSINMFIEHKMHVIGGRYQDTISNATTLLYKIAEAVVIEKDLLNKEW